MYGHRSPCSSASCPPGGSAAQTHRALRAGGTSAPLRSLPGDASAKPSVPGKRCPLHAATAEGRPGPQCQLAGRRAAAPPAPREEEEGRWGAVHRYRACRQGCPFAERWCQVLAGPSKDTCPTRVQQQLGVWGHACPSWQGASQPGQSVVKAGWHPWGRVRAPAGCPRAGACEGTGTGSAGRGRGRFMASPCCCR